MVSRGIIVSILSLSMLQGCSSMSMSTGGQDGIMDVIIKAASRDPLSRPWDPPIEVGYGARIPPMEGDWERHCADRKGQDPVCR
jgi:hypothetical protein